MAENIFFKCYNEEVEVKFQPKRHWYYVRGSGPSLSPTKFQYTPSVTTVANLLDKSSWLIPWTNKLIRTAILAEINEKAKLSEEELEEFIQTCFRIPETQRDEAGTLGSDVHSVLEFQINRFLGIADTKAEELSSFISDENSKRVCQEAEKNFLSWQKKSMEWEFSERFVYSKSYHYVGTCDAFCWIDDVPVLVDFKTSPKVYDTHKLQTAAYCQCVYEEFGVAPERRLILRIDKETGELEEHWDQEGDWEASWQEDFKGFMGLRQAYLWARGK